MSSAACGGNVCCHIFNRSQKAETQPEQATQNGRSAPSMDTAAQQELTVYGSWSNFEAVALDWNKIYPNIYYQLFQN